MKLRYLLFAALMLVPTTSALACAPAPSCWIKNDPTYLRDVCRNFSNQTVSQIAENVEEPEKIQDFVKACKKLGVSPVKWR
jgi:hypothetical protein